MVRAVAPCCRGGLTSLSTGKQVVSRLLSVNTTVTVLDIARHSDELEHIQAQYPNADLHFVQGDIRDPVALAEAIGDGVLGTIHLAGYSRIQYCLENLRDCEDVNVDGTDKLLQALKGDGWFILASSSEVSDSLSACSDGTLLTRVSRYMATASKCMARPLPSPSERTRRWFP